MDLVCEAAQPPVLTAPFPNGDQEITFRHPMHNDDAPNIMLVLFASDAIENPITNVPSWGLYAQYALDACGIIACNRLDGWLSKYKDANRAAAPDGRVNPGSILQGTKYYFHIPKLDGDDAPDTPYPIFGSFSQWSFPHNKLPNSWTQTVLPDPQDAPPFIGRYPPSELKAALKDRDGTCRITHCISGVQVAHLCPRREARWYSRNNMAPYGGHIDNSANALLLQADLHQCFNECKFVFAPKPLAGPQGTSLHFVVHMMEETKDLHILYHNRKLQGMSVKKVLPWMFVRFAWALFQNNGALLKPKHFASKVSKKLAVDLIEEEAQPEDETPTETSQKSRLTRSAKRQKLDSGGAAGGATSAAGLAEATSEDQGSPSAPSEDQGSPSAPSEDQGSPSAPSEGPSSPLVPSTRFPSAPASPPRSHSGQPAGDGEGEPAFEAKVREWLERERERSDSERHWEKEKAWAHMVVAEEKILDGASARRLVGIQSGGGFMEPDEVGSPFGEEAREPEEVRELEEAGMEA